MNRSALIIAGDNCGIYNLSLVNAGDPNATAVIINGDNFQSDGVGIENFSIGYSAENRSNISINNNFFLLPKNPNLPIVRATLFTNCKSIKLTNNTVIFESIINFQKIKEERQATIKTTEYEKLKASIRAKFSYSLIIRKNSNMT